MIIEEHKKELVKARRMPVDFGDAERYLAEYGWHSGNVSAPGNQAPLWLLQEGSRQGTGSFGAYSFSQRAFEQAKKQWWIHGVIEKGKDLLYPLNRNAHFDPSIIGHGKEVWYGPLKLSKPYPDDGKEPRFVYQYDIAILSPDYVDMCGCTMTTTVRTPEEQAKDKPCVQGGTIAPGESCYISIELPAK